ncbi:MAG: paraquat-inducible protein A [Gammaproteobacteria bacterium]
MPCHGARSHGTVYGIQRGDGRALFFAAVVVLTMLVAESFDPRLIWDFGNLKQPRCG